ADAGAMAVLWEPPYAGPGVARDLPLLAVDGLSRQVGHIAGRFFGHPSRDLKVVGITGTDGKTSCAHFIAQALHGPRTPSAILGTLGYGVYGRTTPASHTTPEALTLHRLLAAFRDQGVAQVAMEVSSHALEQGRVAGVDFAAAVLTNVTRDHLDYHGSLGAYAAAKQRLFTDCRPAAAVLNLDDAVGRSLAGALAGGGRRVVGYGLGARPTDGLDGFVWGEDLQLYPAGLGLRISSSWGAAQLHAGLLGHFNASNLLAALAALLALELPLAEAVRRLSQATTVAGRMERFGGEGGRPLAVVDYAHTPHALERVLTALKEHLQGRLWCVFGCGGDRDPGKRPEMGAIAERYADHLIVTDDNPRREDPQRIVGQILAGMQNPAAAQVIRDRRQAILTALGGAAAADIILIAGKGHEDYQLLGAQRLPFSDRDVVRRWLETGP
nr:UDP-N-acetylmuramoyl-L-alanyl-D-glutamate--2,6-diaminopimelate ligase [Pseudomonadota bacterium]